MLPSSHAPDAFVIWSARLCLYNCMSFTCQITTVIYTPSGCAHLSSAYRLSSLLPDPLASQPRNPERRLSVTASTTPPERSLLHMPLMLLLFGRRPRRPDSIPTPQARLGATNLFLAHSSPFPIGQKSRTTDFLVTLVMIWPTADYVRPETPASSIRLLEGWAESGREREMDDRRQKTRNARFEPEQLREDHSSRIKLSRRGQTVELERAFSAGTKTDPQVGQLQCKQVDLFAAGAHHSDSLPSTGWTRPSVLASLRVAQRAVGRGQSLSSCLLVFQPSFPPCGQQSEFVSKLSGDFLLQGRYIQAIDRPRSVSIGLDLSIGLNQLDRFQSVPIEIDWDRLVSSFALSGGMPPSSRSVPFVPLRRASPSSGLKG
ncbi:unnamed protein product [Protopolystoma xenopodis]|uniref:Uncharacterized protein n=1 Tax=Protopolystoma xenopodis TaxID=117903 RepID=A0A448XLT3_9PLAT|nr:unnamed protein product [Protopolystoma xenopodis]